LEGNADQPALSDQDMKNIVKQLRIHPVIQKIIKPVITVDDFWSIVKCVPKKRASSYSGRGIPYYKACAENMDDGLTEAMYSVHAASVQRDGNT
jgi:hypothetical protein